MITKAEGQDSFADTRDMPVGDLLAALSDSEILKTLGIGKDDLQRASSDPVLLETLRITHEFLAELREGGVLDTFFLLPRLDQMDFVHLVGATDDPELRRHRAQSFVSALKESPLGHAQG